MDAAAQITSLETIAESIRKSPEKTADLNTALTHVEQAVICIRQHTEKLKARAEKEPKKEPAKK